MTISAKFASICPKCSTSILVGDRVEWVKGSKATHTSCPVHGSGCNCSACQRVMRPQVPQCLHSAFHRSGCTCAQTSRQRTQDILAFAADQAMYLSEQEMDADDASYEACLKATPAPVAAPAARLSVEDAGVYVLPTGEIVKMKANAAKTAVYPMIWTETSSDRLDSEDQHATGEFRYEENWLARSEIRQRVEQTGRKMNLEEAKAFIRRYGMCVRCGRHLKVAQSVERGLGPVCVKFFEGTAAELLLSA